jgi:recombination protein RecA
MMSQALRKLTGIISKTRTVLIFINQTRAMIGGMVPGQETTPGGKALKFYASVRIELKRVVKLKKEKKLLVIKLKQKLLKIKWRHHLKQLSLIFIMNEGISYEADLINLGEKLGVIKKSGNSYFFEETKLGGSFQSAREF